MENVIKRRSLAYSRISHSLLERRNHIHIQNISVNKKRKRYALAGSKHTGNRVVFVRRLQHDCFQHCALCRLSVIYVVLSRNSVLSTLFASLLLHISATHPFQACNAYNRSDAVSVHDSSKVTDPCTYMAPSDISLNTTLIILKHTKINYNNMIVCLSVSLRMYSEYYVTYAHTHTHTYKSM